MPELSAIDHRYAAELARVELKRTSESLQVAKSISVDSQYGDLIGKAQSYLALAHQRAEQIAQEAAQHEAALRAGRNDEA